ncbi:MAG: bifunctional folylpolyglutamate synthase/dihydrofolate synthase [Lachnospiraceae bacterium]|nr:bifunctional folylpolyglutamate synthase/dihydrofolate synthase [Lachnospiraceae bacterium]
MVCKNITCFGEAEQYLYDMPRFTSKHSIKETREFLKEIGNPDLSFKIIHVAGTNGKGSTCAYLDSVLRTAGIKTGLFTSPHLVDICERIKIDGKDISHDEFYSAFMDIYNRIDHEAIAGGENAYHPTFFEYLFFMAMIIFKNAGIEWCILETGLGGLLDATNSVVTKEVAVITKIGLDHTEYLGDTKALIAVQKAGIIKEGKPVVYLDAEEESSNAIASEAKRIGAGRLIPVNEKNVKLLQKLPEKVAFSLMDGYYKYVSLCLDTIAEYQVQNASLAVKTIEAVGLSERVSEQCLCDGLYKCHWAGRMEEILPDVFVDGAHNPDGIEAFIKTVADDGISRKRRLIFGVVSDKDYTEMIRELSDSKLFESITIAPINSYRSADAGSIADGFVKAGALNVRAANSAKQALETMLFEKYSNSAEDTFRLYIAGSLYLVGEIKSILPFIKPEVNRHD